MVLEVQCSDWNATATKSDNDNVNMYLRENYRTGWEISEAMSGK